MYPLITYPLSIIVCYLEGFCSPLIQRISSSMSRITISEVLCGGGH